MEDLSELQSRVQSALVNTTRSASALANQDLTFHRSLSSRLSTALDKQNARLLELSSRLAGVSTSTEETVRPLPSLKTVDSIDGNWRLVVDVIDSLLERTDTALDEFTGAVRRLSPGVGTEQAAPPKLPKTSKIAMQLRAQDMEKPQLHFECAPNNNESGPFRPLLRSKPHAILPLETEPVATDELSRRQYSHPYQLEIEQYRYPPSVYTQADPIPYHPFDSSTATFVDSEEALADMLHELKQAKEIAIDLEHHDQRSYVGIVCLMQISTRDRDWIVDTLKPWRRRLECLNQVFADPSIIKVLHGAYMDVVWLQRDLGLYIVGLFDTHFAARALGYSGGSLAYLLKRFVNVDAQKQYQMADWRIRPLPQELVDYARSDTHYLLYIYDCMRNELVERSNFALPDGDKLWDVLMKSTEISLQRYEHSRYDAELGQGSAGWYKMLSRTPALLTKEQFAVFRGAHQWRDNVAREQDDSVHYVFPNHQLFTISREMPTNRAAMLGLMQPTTQTVRLRVDELVDVIVSAKQRGKTGPEMAELLREIEPHYPRGTNEKAEARRAPAGNDTDAKLVNGIGLSILPQALRSKISAFWGSAFESSAHQRRSLSTAADINLTVPLPQLTAEGFSGPANDLDVTPIQNTTAATKNAGSSSPAQPEEELDDVFVLNDLRRKRKREPFNLDDNDASSSSSPAQQFEDNEDRDDTSMLKISTRHSRLIAQSDDVAAQKNEVGVFNEGEWMGKEKMEKKRAKREAKNARKAAAAADIQEEAPFDYTSASSVLHPPRDDESADRGGRKKHVDPYRKVLDTQKGAPRPPAAKERSGRSMTYRSS